MRLRTRHAEPEPQVLLPVLEAEPPLVEESAAEQSEVARVVRELNEAAKAHAVRFAATITAMISVAVVHALWALAARQEPMIWVMVLFGLFGPMLAAIQLALPDRRLKRLTRQLAEYDDTTALAPLFEYSRHILPRATKRALAETRGRLARRVRASDAPRFTDRDHREFRYHLLLVFTSAGGLGRATTKDLLTALGQIGDQRELELVRRVSELRGASQSEKETVALAKECAALIAARLEEDKDARTLLRPSAAAAAPSTLLRSAGAGGSVETDSLLRAAEAAEPQGQGTTG
jgi:hypothetical protein